MKTNTEAWNYDFNGTGSANKGIFGLMGVSYGQYMPWIYTEDYYMSAAEMDLDYYGGRGNKLCSPLVSKLIELHSPNDGYLNIQDKQKLTRIITSRFLEQWQKRWAALTAEYEPLENYSMLEELTDDDTTVTHGKTTTRTGSVELTPEAVTTVESSVYAYDSSLPTPDAKTVSTPTGSNTTEYNDLTDTEGGTTGTTHSYEKTRSGNIGVTTSQQMLEAELEVRKYDFFASMYDDVDKVLTIPVY